MKKLPLGTVLILALMWAAAFGCKKAESAPPEPEPVHYAGMMEAGSSVEFVESEFLVEL